MTTKRSPSVQTNLPLPTAVDAPWSAAFSAHAPFWIVFATVQLFIALLGVTTPGWPLGDVGSVYRFWSSALLDRGEWMGIDAPFVYPYVALVPMLIPWLFGSAGYLLGWLVLVLVLNTAAALVVTKAGGRPERYPALWWWLAFLVALGPVSFGRIDSICVPIAMIALSLVAERPAVAGALLALGAWIKIWPAAIGVALVVVLKRWASVLTGALAVTAIFLAVGFLFGGAANVLSFVVQQDGRGLQVESVFATGWLWAAADHQAWVEYDNVLYTNQLAGSPGISATAAMTTPLMVVAVVVLCLLGWLVRRSFALNAPASAELSAPGADTREAELSYPLAVLMLGLVTAMIVFNRVGSPQFIIWFAVPVVFGLVTTGRRFAPFAILVTMIAALTQVIYPYLYGYLLSLYPWMLVVITARNALMVVLFGWCVARLALTVRWQTALRRTRPLARVR